MRQFDERFLAVHPATSLWWGQRDQCETCRFFNLREGHEGEAIMRCIAALKFHRPSREMLGIYCIDARSENGPCGPDAKLWEPK